MKQIIFVLIISFLLASCKPKPVQSEIYPEPTTTFGSEIAHSPIFSQTPTANQKPTQASQPTETPTLFPTAPTESAYTPVPAETQSAREIVEATTTAREGQFQATLTAFGIECDSPEWWKGLYTSPDGRWTAAGCEGEKPLINSFLQVVNTQRDKNWSVYYKDYAKGIDNPNIYTLRPFHWSKNGKYLYIVAESRMSGCCWMGYELLLVRLDLENGRQTTIFNFVSDGHGPPGVDVSISSSDRYVLTVPQDGKDLLLVLDLMTWEQKAINLNYTNTGAGETLMSNDDSKVILVIRQYPEVYQGDLTYGSLVLIDLKNQTQRVLLSGYEFWDTPKPYSWKDDEHVLLCSEQQCDNENFLLLNINNGELIEVTNP